MKLTLLFFFAFAPNALAFEWMANPMKGWEENEVVVRINPAQCPAKNTLPETVNKGIALWNSVSGSRIRLKLGENTNTTGLSNEPTIECSTAFGQNDTVGTTSIASDSDGNIVAARVVLNARTGSQGNISGKNATMMELAVAHELGHVLGLGHSSQDPALMYYNISNKQDLALHQDDIDGLLSIYAGSKKKKGILGCGSLLNSDQDSDPTGAGPMWSFLPLLAAMFTSLGFRFIRRNKTIIAV